MTPLCIPAETTAAVKILSVSGSAFRPNSEVRNPSRARRGRVFPARARIPSKLSEKAKATSEPILEILNNDILRCSHGATVGPVDPEHLFYLESRGIPHPVAERMLVQGFLGEVLDRIPVAQVREAVDQELAARIE